MFTNLWAHIIIFSIWPTGKHFLRRISLVTSWAYSTILVFKRDLAFLGLLVISWLLMAQERISFPRIVIEYAVMSH